MKIYKELYIYGNRQALEQFQTEIHKNMGDDWVKPQPDDLLKDYILIDYVGRDLEPSRIAIYYNADELKEDYIRVVNIIPLKKSQLSIEEYNKILDKFYCDIVKPYGEMHKEIVIEKPTTDEFDPLKYISVDALQKLRFFCNAANKTTGSSHPCDEERWYDFICQTVVDNKVFDYDTLYNFLIDKEYWGEKESDIIAAIGHYAWDEEQAMKLASEYDNYVRFLQFYRKWETLNDR